MNTTKLFVFLFLVLTSFHLQAKEIVTNEFDMHDAPDWLLRTRVDSVTDHIQMHLEWTIRKINVYWYPTEEAYEKAQNLGPMSLAVTKYDGGKASVLIGPKVNDSNFDETFGHELVHVIAFQKYKGSIPKWLEEGLANYFSRKEKVDYKWLAKHPFIDDVHHLAHPFNGSPADILYRYKASQAFAEMLQHKCGDLEELIRISLTRNMETYMHTYCEIKDLNAAFRDWVKKKAATT